MRDAAHIVESLALSPQYVTLPDRALKIKEILFGVRILVFVMELFSLHNAFLVFRERMGIMVLYGCSFARVYFWLRCSKASTISLCFLLFGFCRVLLRFFRSLYYLHLHHM